MMRANKLVIGCAGALLALCLQAHAKAEAWRGHPRTVRVLTENYVRYLVAQQAAQQAAAIENEARTQDHDDIQQASRAWVDRSMAAIREDLTKQIGSDSRRLFESFFSAYTTGEAAGDSALLETLARAFQFDPPPADYNAFKKQVLTQILGDEIKRSSRWLSEVQTWADLRKRRPDTPPLRDWLDRNTPVARTTTPARHPVNALQDAEPDLPDFVEEKEDEFSPLDSFDSMRAKRRKKALEEAQAGMKQVAEERKAVEEEYAAKKLAAAQAEATAMKRQATKLAAVEKEALDQRQKSWGNRLKKLVGATISSGVGAFTGGVGTVAAERAANAVFD